MSIVADENVRLTAENRRLKKRLDQAIKALEFYADPKGYTEAGVKTDGAAFGWDHPDRGAHARSTLNQIAK